MMRWATLLVALLLLSHAVVWSVGRAYERGRLALLFQAVEQGAQLNEATQSLWAAVDRDVRICHDRLMRLAMHPPPRVRH